LLTFAAGITSLAVWGFVAGRSEAAREAERERPIKTPLRVSIDEQGATIVTLAPDVQKRSGIEATTPKSVPYQDKIRAYGAVLDLDKLTTLDNNYVTAGAQLQSAQAKLAASKAAFERTQELYKDRTTALAQVQTNQATFLVDQAAVATAEAQVRTLKTTAYQEWGPVIGKAVVEGGGLVTQLLERQAFLIQITLPPGVSITPPPRVSVQLGAGASRPQAQFVSIATQADPKIQGLSYYYTATADTQLLPGISVLALLPSGAPRDGIAVPATAVVWWAGRPWVYLRTGPDTFTRHPLPSNEPASADGGFEVPAESFPQHPPQLVTAGAQALLSEEFRAQIQVGEDSKK